MLFRKKKNLQQEIDYHALVLKYLQDFCETGQIIGDAFVLEKEDIYIYADVVSADNNVAQILFQLHHEWLTDAIVESVAASGSSVQEAIALACEDFCHNL